MIALVRFPRNPRLDPHRLAIGFTTAELVEIQSGGRLALAGRSIGLEGTDFLFLAALGSADGAKGRMLHVLEKLDPKVPDGYRFPVADCVNGMWHLPVSVREHEIAHVNIWSRVGFNALKAGNVIFYRSRIFRESLSLAEGVHPRKTADRAIQQVFDRGEGLAPGSVEVTVRALANERVAARWSRHFVGVDPNVPVGAIPGVTPGVIEFEDPAPPDWLPHWESRET